MSYVAVALGAAIILSRNEGGPDSAFSLEPNEFKTLVQSIREAEKLIGSPAYKPGKNESENIIFRKLLFVVKI